LKNKDKNIQSDCIKVLYEIGLNGSGELISSYTNEFGALLKSNNNRLVWGAMIALNTISKNYPEKVFELLPQIISAIDQGSTITIDHGVGILAKLSSFNEYIDIVFPLLIEQLKRCPIKQLPLYAEKSVIAINPTNKNQFVEMLEARIAETDKNSQKSRIVKILKQLNK